MLRALLVAIVNLLLAVGWLLSLPFRVLRREAPAVYVRFRLEGDPPYRKIPGVRLFRRQEPDTVASLDELSSQIDHLRADPHVKGAVFELEDLAVAPAKRQSLAALFERLRAAGKEVWGYAASAGNSEYALLCRADRIAMPAAGRLELTGFSAEATALGEGLRRLGVSAQFVRRGDHKTAPELFTHDTVSEIQRRTLETILDERHQELVEAVSSGRKLSSGDAVARIDHGPYGARRAQAAGLVDVVCGEAELEKALAREGAPPPKLRSHDEYLAGRRFPRVPWRKLRAPPRLGLIRVRGPIVHARGGASPFQGIAASGPLTRAIRTAARDRRCKAVLLYVDSPGGSALASELLLEELKRLQKKKKVVAYFDRVAASGGYMAALGAHEIWAGPHAIAGSIGVFAGKFDLSGLLARAGIRREVITRGENAGLQSTSRPFTPGERQALEADVEETYQAFLDHVAAARQLPVEEVRERAEGRIYSGQAARDAKLVDRVGLFEDACRRALELGGVRGDSFRLHPYAARGKSLSWLSLLRTVGQVNLFTMWFPWFTVGDRRVPAAEPGP